MRDIPTGSEPKIIRPSTVLLAGALLLSFWILYRRSRQRGQGRYCPDGLRLSELQDTYLQSVQASKMLADQARCDATKDAGELRETMATLSGWLGQAISEGQDALNALRSVDAQGHDLAEAFERASDISESKAE